jgi:spore coat protein U-like protein
VRVHFCRRAVLINAASHENREIERITEMNCLVTTVIFFCALFYVGECRAFNCRISTTPVNFGVYDVFSRSVLDSTGTITVICNNPQQKPITITVTLNAGGSGSFNPRQMRASGGTDRLNYYLFSDPSRTIIWGDGTGGSSYVTGVVTRYGAFNALVYGRIPAGQNVSLGNYGDVLTATVNW